MNDQELRQWLQINLKVNPKDLNVYRMAITTRQYEVLEFFGDSVLGFMVSEYLKNMVVLHLSILSYINKVLIIYQYLYHVRSNTPNKNA
jgi:hypothetical protein